MKMWRKTSGEKKFIKKCWRILIEKNNFEEKLQTKQEKKIEKNSKKKENSATVENLQ